MKGVAFDLRAGEVHALVGENGAGKSTLIKIITGAEQPDSGELRMGGHTMHRMDRAAARAQGIVAIFQQPALFPHLAVAENIALSLKPAGSCRRVDRKERQRRAAELLGWLGASIDPRRPVETLSMPEQPSVEIAKAISAEARIAVMDEPAASLTEREVEKLFGNIGRLHGHGVGIIYISHRLKEVYAIADRITVLRDGEAVDALRERPLRDAAATAPAGV